MSFLPVLESRAFLRAIRESPEDDAPRLIYADWLEERGDSDRAEFIRVQAEYAKLCFHYQVHSVRDGGHCQLCRRGDHLSRLLVSKFYVPQHGPATFAKDCPCYIAPAARRDSHCTWDWHRGFVCHLNAPMSTFMEIAAPIFAAHPITRVALVDRDPVAATAHDHSRCFAWFVADEWQHTTRRNDSYLLERRIFDLLAAEATELDGYSFKKYDTANSALGDLHRAAWLLGRGLAAKLEAQHD